MSNAVLVQIIITIGAIIVAFLGGVFSRRTRHVTAEVTLSVEARNWAKAFEDRATRAEQRAERAEQAAASASQQAQHCQNRVNGLIEHVEHLERVMQRQGIDPPSIPPWLLRT